MADTYPATRIEKYGDFTSISVHQLPFSELAENEVLIHMEYSTINPSDVNAAKGRYPIGPAPVTLGFEGSGTVVKSGGSERANSLLGKRVAVRGRGTWAEYQQADAENLFPLLDSTTFEQAANLIVNPMTVALFVEKIKNAAASALGKMLNKWLKILNIPLVNLVRREEQVEILKNIGAEYVINTSEEGWKQRAKELCSSLGVTIGFDAIAGDATADLANSINDGGVIYNYGGLSGQGCSIGPVNLIFQRKRLEGLWLTPWLSEKNFNERVEVGNLVQSLLTEVFATEHARCINLTQIQEIIATYSETSNTNNKVLIRTRLE